MDDGDSKNGSPLSRFITLLGRPCRDIESSAALQVAFPLLALPIPPHYLQWLNTYSDYMLFTTHDSIYHGTRLGHNQGLITSYAPQFPFL